MHWKRIVLSTLTCAAVAAATFTASTAEAGGDATGSLGYGGVAKGDISMTAGETDRVTVDLLAGAAFDVTFSSSFPATVLLTDPDAQPVDLQAAPGMRLKIRGATIAKSGTYTFAISSSDGSQGLYSLAVVQKWAKAVPVSGTGYTALDVPMPASGKVSAVISRDPNEPGQPRILSFLDPTAADLLGAPIEPKRNTVKLPSTGVTLAGTYQLVVTTTDGGSRWSGAVKRSVPRVKPARISLSNGLDTISWANDGVDRVFQRNCSGCHSWANSYNTVRGSAQVVYGRIKSGSMPPTGRLPSPQIALVQAWIQTGKNR